MTEPETSPPKMRVSPALTMVLHARTLEASIEEVLQPLHLSLRKLGVLGHLRAAPGLSYSALARRARIKVQSLHPIIDALESVEYVRTTDGVSQGRSAALEITDAGADAMQEAHHAISKIDETVFAEGDWAILGDALDRIATSFLRRAASSE